MYKHLDYCTHMKFEEDRDILRRPLFDVNMRLFHSSEQYNFIVRAACSYLRWCTETEKEGYKKPHGYSGANAGIPWNIICVAFPTGGTVEMINPKIVNTRGAMKSVKSNCGSLTLDKPREITRDEEVEVEYFDILGLPHTKWFGPTPGFTIQHEIQHNLGILITDLK